MGEFDKYHIHKDLKFGPAELFDISSLAAEVGDEWFNQSLARVNDCVVRFAVMEGDFHWHKHDNEDELFYVIDGHLLIDLENETLDLSPNQAVVIPRGMQHRPRAPERTVILMFEGSGIEPTGD